MKDAVCLTFLALILLTPAPSAGAGTSHGLYQRLEEAALGILVDGRLSGSGWFASGHGLAVTAGHILKGSGRIEVLSPVAGRLSARLVATDLAHDLALLLVERRGPLFPALEIAPSVPDAGDRLYLMGSPYYRHRLMVSGELAKGRSSFEWNAENHAYTEVFSIAAVIAEGFSGGPWVNERGEVVGVQSGVMSWKGAPVGIAFMSPAKAAADLVQQKKNLRPLSFGVILAESWEPPWVSETKTAPPEEAGLKIVQLLPGSPLTAAGIRRGDRIMELNDAPVFYRDDFLHSVRSLQAGEKATLRVRQSDGRERTIDASPVPNAR